MWYGRETPSWDRYHIDWVLYANPTKGSSTIHLEPRLSLVLTDKREDGGYPIDHFPVLVMFQNMKQ